MKSKMYRVVIVEPSTIIRVGIKQIIEENPSFVIVGELNDAHHLEEKIATMRADIVIVNPAIIGFHKRNTIKSIIPNTIVIGLIYSHIESDLLKQFNSIIDIYDDPTKISHRLTEALSATTTEDSTSDNSDLSDREKEILIAVAKGMMNKEIATLHNISIHTVISHRKNISRKTGIKSVSGFVVYALLNNLIEQGELQ
ncbi:MAG: response regulator transcription factor [Rikenellaceae bacterium]